MIGDNEPEVNFKKINNVIYQETLFLLFDLNGVITYVNDKCGAVLGYQPWELIGKHTRVFKTDFHSDQFYQSLWETLLSGNRWKDEVAVKRKDGTVTWNLMSIFPLMDSNNNLCSFLTLETDITREITEQKHLFEKMEKMEYHDILTGLPNYKQLDECLSKEIEQAKENNTLIAVVHLDIDDFKYVNNMFGRQAANQLLIDFSSRVKDSLNGNICMFRPGGDEFILIIKDLSDFEEVTQILAKVHSDMNKEPYRIKENEVHISASIGVSIFPYSGETKDKLLENTEIAMYGAKKAGKNQYQIFSPTMNLDSYKQFTLRNDSKKALVNNEYIIDFQPRFNPLTDTIVSAEALIRWNHPKWGIVSPTEFIFMAEESGLIVQLGEWVIKRVCKQIKEWQSESLAIRKISMNLSALQLLQPNFVEMVSSILKEYSVSPKWIEFEITETVIIQKEQQVLNTLKDLRNLGITIALDDFGAGFSSLNYLSKFPCQIIKIDKSLIDNIHKDDDSYEITSSIIRLCHKLRKTVVAEGVETNEQLSLLKELKCDEIQGYLFSRPVTEEVFKGFLQKDKWMKTDNEESRDKTNQRKYFRVKLKVPLLADMTIDKVGNKKLNIGSSQVFIEDIGPGGLCFHSSLQLPVKEEIQLLFLTEIFFKELKLIGHIVWRKEWNSTFYKYGVSFLINNRDQEELIKLLNSLQVKLKKTPVMPGCRFATI